MSFEITTAFVKQYKANIQLLSQQKGSVLRACVREEPIVGEIGYFDQIGATTAKKRTTRHGNTPLISTPHDRRKVAPVDFDWADLIDSLDKVKLLNDPTSSYAINAAYAMGRAMDDEIIAKFLATAYTGKEGAKAVAFPSGNIVAVGTSGLTITKLLAAKLILDSNDIDPEIERFIACGAKQVGDLLNTTEVKSADYNTVKALAEGKIDTFMGFKFKMINRLAKSSTTRKCLCWAKDGVLLGINAEATGRITERADKNYSTQVYYSQALGSTRMEEKKCVEIDCKE